MTAVVKSKPIVPPSPSQKPLVGHAVDFAFRPLDFLLKANRETAGIALLNVAGQKWYLITDPDAVEYVLVTNSRNFNKGFFYDRVRPLFGNGLVTSEGDFWRHQRRLIQPAFHRARINSYAKIMSDYAEEMVVEDWRDGQIRHISEDMMELTLKIVARLLFNLDVADDEALKTGRAISEALTTVSKIGNSVIKIPENIPTPSNIKYREAMEQVNKAVSDIVTKGRASLAQPDANHDDLLSMLLEVQDEDGQGMSDQQLRDEVLTLYLAGHETTAMTLTWAWYLLAQHPEVEQKLVAELQSILHGRIPTVEDLPNLTYTDWVIKETLRLYPVGWVFARQAINACEINGYPIAAGSVIMLSPWATHRDPRVFDHAEEFLPERWEPEISKQMHKFAYYPFAAGPRQCIGNTFALVEATSLLAIMAQKYKLSLLPGEKVKPVVSGTIHPKKPLLMQLRKR